MEEDRQLKHLFLLLPTIVGLVIVGIGGIVSIDYIRPGDKENLLLVGQMMAILSPVLVGLLVLLKVERVEVKVDDQHQQMNSRMDELLKRTAEEGYARGLAAGDKR